MTPVYEVLLGLGNMRDETRTLEELDGENWGEPATAPTPMVARCLRSRRTPLRELSHADLRLLISQQIGLQHLVPKALALICDDVLLAAEFYPGDLLTSLLRVNAHYWSQNSAQRDRVASLAQPGIRQDRTIMRDYEAFVAANYGRGETPC
jgi:hypothetical protein